MDGRGRARASSRIGVGDRDEGSEAREVDAEMAGGCQDDQDPRPEAGPTQNDVDSALGLISASSQSRSRQGQEPASSSVGALAEQLSMMQASIFGTLRGSLKEVHEAQLHQGERLDSASNN